MDWWAFGILIFEMLAGQPPFCADDPMEIYQKILRNKVNYPAAFSKNVRDILSKLLVSNPAARLGSLKNKVLRYDVQPLLPLPGTLSPPSSLPLHPGSL